MLLITRRYKIIRFVALKIVDITDNTKYPDLYDEKCTLRAFWKFGVLVKCFWQEGIKVWRVADWMDASVGNVQKHNDFWDIPRGCIVKCLLGNKIEIKESK